MRVAVLFLVFFTLFGLFAQAEGTRKNDDVVTRLRELLAAAGVSPVPDPPRELGIHSACIKHGMGCPDSYVEYLMTHIKTPSKPQSSPSQSSSTETSTSPSKGERWEQQPPRDRSRKGAEHYRPRKEEDAMEEAKLENLRHLRNVMRDRLVERQLPENKWKCHEFRWLRRGLMMVQATHSVIVDRNWDFIMYRFFPCVVLTALVAWVLFGDSIPRQHVRSLLADDPTWVLNDIMLSHKSPHSVGELVMERESYNFLDVNDPQDVNDGDFLDGFAKIREEAVRSGRDHRRERWLATRFALIEAHQESHMAGVVLRLRLVLSASVLLMLLWTLLSLVLRAAELRGNSEDGGVLHLLLVMFCPAWMSVSLALYFGWSWIGGMVAYAAWEMVAAGEALVRLGERTAALHERILQRWCG